MKTLLSIIFILFSGFFLSARAVDFTVNLTTDQHDANTADGICDVNLTTAGEQCTLRAAIEQANASAADDRVFFNLPANSTVTLTTANGGEISVGNNGVLEIVGTGANNLTINGGAGTNRIFYTDNATVVISAVTLTGGNGTGANFSGSGGAIFVLKGTLFLDRVHVTGNSASQSGGVYFSNGGTHRITNSTFSANTAGDCGAFGEYNGPSLTVINSTISGNTATGSAGGFCNQNSFTELRSVTITKNTATHGGGFAVTSGTLFFGNTIVAGNTATNGSSPEIEFNGSTIVPEGSNFIGDSPGDSTNTLNPVDRKPSDIFDVSPMLGALANNGGATPTHALLAGSPAINKGTNSLASDPVYNFPLTTDQRGSTRIVGDTIDIGAYESDTPAPPSSPTPTPTPACAYSISPGAQNFPSSGGSGSIQIITTTDCVYAAAVTSDSPFIAITSGATGRGSGGLSFTVQANSGAARTGTIIVAGQIFTVSQAVFRRKKTLLSPISMNVDFGSVLFQNAIFSKPENSEN